MPRTALELESKPSPIDFLSKPAIPRLRKEIQNICDSYSHPWDVLAELCQNSVDAITLHQKLFGEDGKEHSIHLNLDARERSIRIRDTGKGFSARNFERLLSPHGTDKEDDLDLIGEKGVGLTYTIFVCNHYEIKTKSSKAYIHGIIQNASLWKQNTIQTIPVCEIQAWKQKTYDPAETHTEIYLKGVERIDFEEEDIFLQSPKIIEYLLRTKTAIGSTRDLFGKKPLKINVVLTTIDMDGKKTQLPIKFEYMLPTQLLVDPSKAIDLDTFKETAADLDDRQKAKRLLGRAITSKKIEERAGRSINYYAFFAPSRKLWHEISEKNGLMTLDENNDEIPLYTGGIYVATRGMPTGITIEPPITGVAGYWANCYIIFEDNHINFDVGRKSIPGRTKGILRDIAKKVFQGFMPFVQYVSVTPAVKGGTSASIQAYEKNKTFEFLKKLPNLGISKIGYCKHPDRQEAAVAALFHEMVGAGILKGYRTLTTGYKQTYDLWAYYRISKDLVGSQFSKLANDSGFIELPTVIEFKYRAEDILKDFQDDRKFFADIDLLVAWDLDERKFGKEGVKTELLAQDDTFYFGSNYKLSWPGSYNLGNAGEKALICLRKLVGDLITKKH